MNDIQVLEEKIKTLSVLVSRANLLSRLGTQFGGNRDLYKEFGYPDTVEYDDCFLRYKRQDIANAVINRPVEATWRGDIALIEVDDDKETPLEKEWDALYKRLKLKKIFSRLDRLSHIGTYGVLLFGFNDVQKREDFAKPVSNAVSKLLYVKPLGEKSAQIASWDTNPNSERYGLPEYYDITISEKTGNVFSIRAHYSRILHVADTELESEVEGEPELAPILNRLYDLEKLIGGSAEMFWRGARPGYHGKVDPEYIATEETEKDLKTQIDEYEHNLRRFLISEGVDIQALAQQVADPTAHVDIQIQMISAVTGIPKRILTGSERGELASTQDTENWNSFIISRRTEFVEPCIIRPFVDKLIAHKILPKPVQDYTIDWPLLATLSQKDQAEIGEKKANALRSYTSSETNLDILPPDVFFKYVLNFSDDVIELINKYRDAQIAQEEKDFEDDDTNTEE